MYSSCIRVKSEVEERVKTLIKTKPNDANLISTINFNVIFVATYSFVEQNWTKLVGQNHKKKTQIKGNTGKTDKQRETLPE